MTPERYQRLCDLFDEAQKQDPAERAHFVQQACAEDPSLRRAAGSAWPLRASLERAGQRTGGPWLQA